MNDEQLTFLPATELAAQIRQRAVSPVEAMRATLQRVERVQPALNAFITVCAEQADGLSVRLDVLGGKFARMDRLV